MFRENLLSMQMQQGRREKDLGGEGDEKLSRETVLDGEGREMKKAFSSCNVCCRSREGTTGKLLTWDVARKRFFHSFFRRIRTQFWEDHADPWGKFNDKAPSNGTFIAYLRTQPKIPPTGHSNAKPNCGTGIIFS